MNPISKSIWDIVNSYFNSTKNYLTKNQIDTYNTFVNINIPKTIRQFNPIVLPYSKIEGTDDYKYQLEITIGGSLDTDHMTSIEGWLEISTATISDDKKEFTIEISKSEGGSYLIPSILNDGKGIYVGKPILQKKEIIDEQIEYKETILLPNEARLKNITYQSDIRVDIIIKYTILNDVSPTDAPSVYDKKIKIMRFDKVGLCNIPIMLQSKICSLHNMDKNTLRLAGECEYDQGGYFIIDGKEKVIVAQERQIENKLYINRLRHKNFKLQCEIRSSPEHKFQPARITKIWMMNEQFVLNKNNIKKVLIKDNLFRVTIPQIDIEVPLFVVFRALGIITDWEIINIIVGDNTLKYKNNTKYIERILDVIRPTITDMAYINTQSSALEYLMSKISKNFLSSGDSSRRKKFIIEILRNHFLPHCGENLLDKGFFLGHMVMESIKVYLNINKATDRDSFLYKRVDISGFLISSIFRDLYFRIKNKLIETCNIKYNNKSKFIFDTNGGNKTSANTYWDTHFLNFIGKNNNINCELNIQAILERLIMDEGFMYAFKNCWGLKDAPCKQGVVQDINRISYIGFISHLRRINTPLSSSAKIRAPHSLHGSSWGIMCPSETPDGGNIGLRKNLAILSSITFGTNSKPLERLLFTSKVYDIKTIDSNKNNAIKVFLNEMLVGYTYTPFYLYNKLKLLKRNALINIYTSISWYKLDNIIRISTTSGRGIRPVFIVNKNTINITRTIDGSSVYNIIHELKKGSIDWNHLIGGLLHKDSSKPFSDINENYIMKQDPVTSKFSEYTLAELEKTQGIIEYIDCDESNTSLISLNPDKLEEYDYDYCEISPSLILGVLGNLIPSISMNQAPRNQFSSCHAKQALGLYATNFRNRFDTKGQILNYPQKPLIKSKLSKYLNADNLPHGINAIVAIGCFSGYNQEDSIIFNKDSVARGLFCSTKFRSYSYRDEYKNGKLIEKIVFPDINTIVGLKKGDYSNLDSNGIIKEGTKIKENNIVVSKSFYSDELDDKGNQVLYDKSVFVKKNESGIIDKVYSNTENNGERFCKIRIRKSKSPELGDKFASRHGQKGTVGMLLSGVDLPRTKDGLVPDIIVNAHAFPSRMTIGQFLELLLGKSVVNLGIEADIASFSVMKNDTVDYIEQIQNILEEKCGFNRSGEEVMYSGITGKLMKINYFIGPTFYQRLTHQVSDKIQSRTTGPRTALTHQPVGGRALGGGGRVGEMERDCLLSHGATAFLKESFMERSDKYNFWISYKTGLISAINPTKKIYRDLSADETKQYLDGDIVKKESIGTTNSKFFCVEAPYSFKLLIQEIECMGISSRLVGKSLINKWNLLKKNNTHSLILDESVVQQLKHGIMDDTAYYTNVGDYITEAMRAFHNKIKFHLLSLGRKNISIKDKVKFNLIDLSVGRGGDIRKWAKLGFKQVLGIDLSINNIILESPPDQENSITGARERFAELENQDNTRTREWYNQNADTVKFLVGDTSKKMYIDTGEKTQDSDKIVKIANMCSGIDNSEKWRKEYEEYLATSGNNHMRRFGTAVSFFTIHYLFNTQEKVENFFKNASDNLMLNGYLLITCFDGQAVFEALKKNAFDTLKGYAKNKSGGEDKVWEIKATYKEKLKKLSELPYSIEKGFNNKISIMFKSISDKHLEESLVHPVLLITMAYKFGFELAPVNEIKNSQNFDSSIFNNSTGSFKNLQKQYMTSIRADRREKFSTKIGKDLTKYSNFNRYYIFKKKTEYDDDGHTLTKEACANYIWNNTDSINHLSPDSIRYKDIQLPFISALDNYSITKFIDDPRSLLGLNNYKNKDNLKFYDNTTLSRKIKFKKLYEKIFKLQKITKIYGDINTISFKNTMKYISETVKTGIYIKIVNSVLYQFIPIINIGNKYKDLELFQVDSSGGLSKVSFIGKKSTDEKTVSSVNLERYLENKYGDKIFNEIRLQEALHFDSVNNNIKILIDNCNITLGKEVINTLLPKFYVYYNLIKDVLNKGGVNDAEFVINILDSPVVRYHNQELYAPSILLNKDCSEDTHKVRLYKKTQKLLPILSSKVPLEENYPLDDSITKETYQYSTHSYNNFIDILAPDWYSYAIAKNLVYPNKCFKLDYKKNPDCDIKNIAKPPGDFITAVININSCLLVDYTDYNSLINTNSVILQTKLKGSDLALDFDTGSINIGTIGSNSLEKKPDESAAAISSTSSVSGDASVNFITSSQNTQLQFNYNPNFSKYILYIENIGCDDVLTRCLQFKKPMIIIRNKYNRRLWYDEQLIAFDSSTHNQNVANYIEIKPTTNNIQDIYNLIHEQLKHIKPTIYTKLANNMETFVNKTFSDDAEYIIDIMRDTINLFSKNISNKKLTTKITNIYNSVITSKISLQRDTMGVIIGKGRKNLNRIEYISHTKISWDKSGGREVEFKIRGDIGDVLIAMGLLEKYKYYKYYVIQKQHYNDYVKSELSNYSRQYSLNIFPAIDAQTHSTMSDEDKDSLNYPPDYNDMMSPMLKLTELAKDNTYQIMKIIGAEENVDLVILDIERHSPPQPIVLPPIVIHDTSVHEQVQQPGSPAYSPLTPTGDGKVQQPGSPAYSPSTPTGDGKV